MPNRESKRIKCLVWDLDGTLWDGVLSEGTVTSLRDGVPEALKELDRRGILLSIASKNEPEPALKTLQHFGVSDYFLCPQISWEDKSVSIRRISELLNLKTEAFALIDDNPFERNAIKYSIPEVSVYSETDVKKLLSLPEFRVRFVTEISANRRRMYQADLLRRRAKTEYSGGEDAFLRTLQINASIRPVNEFDLQRVEELTIRTHQLNSTGYTYSYDELVSLVHSPDHIFMVCSMRDKYGDNGQVGLLLLEKSCDALTIKLLIVSCRVMSCGIGGALVAYAVRLAATMGMRLRAEFLETEYNRIMYVTYRFAGFEELMSENGKIILEYQNGEVPEMPNYINWDE